MMEKVNRNVKIHVMVDFSWSTLTRYIASCIELDGRRAKKKVDGIVLMLFDEYPNSIGKWRLAIVER